MRDTSETSSPSFPAAGSSRATSVVIWTLVVAIAVLGVFTVFGDLIGDGADGPAPRPNDQGIAVPGRAPV